MPGRSVRRSSKLACLLGGPLKLLNWSGLLRKKNSHHLSTFNCYQCEPSMVMESSLFLKSNALNSLVFLKKVQLFVYLYSIIIPYARLESRFNFFHPSSCLNYYFSVNFRCCDLCPRLPAKSAVCLHCCGIWGKLSNQPRLSVV